jgi:hypothetical protein
MFREFLTELGLKAPDLIAGMSGGIVNAIVFKRSSPVAYVGSIIVGALMANYFGEPVAGYIGLKPGTAAFLVGLCGMAAVQAIVAVVPRVIDGWATKAGGRNAP